MDSSRNRFAVQVCDDLRVFAGVWPVLADLAAREDVRSYPFQCRDHLEIWLETIGAACGIAPFFAKVSDRSGAPLMLIPLGIRRLAGIRILEFMDAGVADYNAPVLYRGATGLSPPEARALWTSVCRAAPAFDIAVLQKIPEFVAEFRNPLYDLATDSWPDSGHHLILEPAGGDLLQSRRESRDSQRRRARLSEIGKLEFRIARGDGDIGRAFDTFVRQKSRQYRETLGRDGFDVPGQELYYLSSTRKLPEGSVQLSYLSVGTEIIATAWCLIAGRRFYYMMCAYEDGAWRKFAPGRLLLEELIGWACRNGMEAFDFGIGDETYKLRWRQNSLALAGAVEPRTWAGQLYRAGMDARALLKKRLPAPLVKAIKKGIGRGS
ncbi:MAG: GNAT family N-acetyltransferase [Rhizomicrobium sp.]